MKLTRHGKSSLLILPTNKISSNERQTKSTKEFLDWQDFNQQNFAEIDAVTNKMPLLLSFFAGRAECDFK